MLRLMFVDDIAQWIHGRTPNLPSEDEEWPVLESWHLVVKGVLQQCKTRIWGEDWLKQDKRRLHVHLPASVSRARLRITELEQTEAGSRNPTIITRPSAWRRRIWQSFSLLWSVVQAASYSQEQVGKSIYSFNTHLQCAFQPTKDIKCEEHLRSLRRQNVPIYRS